MRGKLAKCRLNSIAEGAPSDTMSMTSIVAYKAEHNKLLIFRRKVYFNVASSDWDMNLESRVGKP